MRRSMIVSPFLFFAEIDFIFQFPTDVVVIVDNFFPVVVVITFAFIIPTIPIDLTPSRFHCVGVPLLFESLAFRSHFEPEIALGLFFPFIDLFLLLIFDAFSLSSAFRSVF